MELAAKRYSVRKFQDRVIEEEKLRKILEAGRLAPTAVNFQPQKIYVVKSKEALEKLNAACGGRLYGAVTALLVCYDRTRDWKNPKEEGCHSGEVDAAIAAVHMMLEACELGIGSCWVRHFNAQETAEAFGLAAEVEPVMIMPIGYAAKDAVPNEKLHSRYRAMEDMVTVL